MLVTITDEKTSKNFHTQKSRILSCWKKSKGWKGQESSCSLSFQAIFSTWDGLRRCFVTFILSLVFFGGLKAWRAFVSSCSPLWKGFSKIFVTWTPSISRISFGTLVVTFSTPTSNWRSTVSLIDASYGVYSSGVLCECCHYLLICQLFYYLILLASLE